MIQRLEKLEDIKSQVPSLYAFGLSTELTPPFVREEKAAAKTASDTSDASDASDAT